MLFKKKKNQEDRIIVVSGLPRSGTSLMMMMMDAAGISPLQDHIRTADEDNPKGYYEYERVKKLPEGDTRWLKDAKGKTVKVITALLEHLPVKYDYDVILMRREMTEILASQRKMLERRGENPDKVSDFEMASLFEKHLEKVVRWLETQKNIRYLDINYNQLMETPAQEAKKVIDFLRKDLSLDAMTAKIDPNLYRQRN
ncbi:MAG: sulfotransferase [Anaerolineales bacterium]